MSHLWDPPPPLAGPAPAPRARTSERQTDGGTFASVPRRREQRKIRGRRQRTVVLTFPASRRDIEESLEAPANDRRGRRRGTEGVKSIPRAPSEIPRAARKVPSGKILGRVRTTAGISFLQVRSTVAKPDERSESVGRDDGHARGGRHPGSETTVDGH